MIDKGALIREQRETLQQVITNAYKGIQALQEVCPHEDLSYVFDGSSGNYDPTENCYWTDWHCNDCNFRWTTDQDDGYHNMKSKYPDSYRVDRTGRKVA